MSYPRKPVNQRSKAFGISLPVEEVARMDALVEITFPNGGHGRRSQFVMETLALGLERRFGANWRQLADGLREREATEQVA